jgi:hypothetical protein
MNNNLLNNIVNFYFDNFITMILENQQEMTHDNLKKLAEKVLTQKYKVVINESTVVKSSKIPKEKSEKKCVKSTCPYEIRGKNSRVCGKNVKGDNTFCSLHKKHESAKEHVSSDETLHHDSKEDEIASDHVSSDSKEIEHDSVDRDESDMTLELEELRLKIVDATNDLCKFGNFDPDDLLDTNKYTPLRKSKKRWYHNQSGFMIEKNNTLEGYTVIGKYDCDKNVTYALSIHEIDRLEDLLGKGIGIAIKK